MIRLTNERVDIELMGKMIEGTISGTHDGWSFQSADSGFVELFPAGVVYSFSQYGPELLLNQLKFQQSIASKFRHLINERCFMLNIEPPE